MQIKASNADGVWNPHIKKLLIIIKAPFWQTTGFKIVLFLAFIILIIIIIRMRTVSLIRNRALLEKQVEERTRTIQERNIQLAGQKEESIVESTPKTLRELIIAKTENVFISLTVS